MVHVVALQPVLKACGLSTHTHMAVEWARAMREAAKVRATTACPACVHLLLQGL